MARKSLRMLLVLFSGKDKVKTENSTLIFPLVTLFQRFFIEFSIFYFETV